MIGLCQLLAIAPRVLLSNMFRCLVGKNQLRGEFNEHSVPLPSTRNNLEQLSMRGNTQRSCDGFGLDRFIRLRLGDRRGISFPLLQERSFPKCM
ncbi:hypothetical protein ASPBRDRAFT_253704 [Aspergillus brasiliensis CBS 101740]|uniref:Secreted protein n=1 Tax=Aspergillus brasiliensis (strain CBS 101740 / IMI 381727 / IBT 21946) TaxID=767769 RepID=A0A1L9V206_ASPBC|nr:hypothetical protein ASPBRDRAFT_253704 [Aspergillus brasiliensis CBS 101740]